MNELPVRADVGGFERGSLVKLKSGSPTMTIREIQTELFTCDWFDLRDYTFKQHTFMHQQLQLIKPETEEKKKT